MPFNFDQKKYMNGIFDFMLENDMTVREFCALTGVSAATLYRARDTDSPMDLRTIRKLDAGIAEFVRSGL